MWNEFHCELFSSPWSLTVNFCHLDFSVRLCLSISLQYFSGLCRLFLNPLFLLLNSPSQSSRCISFSSFPRTLSLLACSFPPLPLSAVSSLPRSQDANIFDLKCFVSPLGISNPAAQHRNFLSGQERKIWRDSLEFLLLISTQGRLPRSQLP